MENIIVKGKAQHTDEWFADRLGKMTASKFQLLNGRAQSKDKPFSKTAYTYMDTLIAEILTNQVVKVHGAPLDWGTDMEPLAIKHFTEATGLDIIDAPFVPCPDNHQLGGSPDGFVKDEKSIIEVKCPYNSANHIAMLYANKMDPKYMAQCQANMYFTKATKCYFISYDPRIEDNELKMFTCVIERDQDYIDDIMVLALQFLDIMNNKIIQITGV